MIAAREAEAELIRYCAKVAVGVLSFARNEREANVLSVAAQVMGSRYPSERANLTAASERYLCAHEDERVSAADTVRKGWIVGLPRLRDLLAREIEKVRKG